MQDVKENLAKRAGGWDPNRFGLYEPEKKKLLKDRRALISQQESIVSGKEILIKDLGMFHASHSYRVREYTDIWNHAN